MSKIGKINISIPDKVKVILSGNMINIEGPLGKKSLNIDLDIFDLDINDGKEIELKTEDQNQIDFENKTDPEILIEENTKQIRLEVENEILDELTELKQTITEVDNKFQTFDLIFISLISLASGVLLALIFIQIRNMRSSKEIQYDFEEASDEKSSLTSLPSDLSIKNDIDQQQFDLAVTYYEMSDKENAVALLKNLIQTTKNSEIREASEDLLEKVKQL